MNILALSEYFSSLGIGSIIFDEYANFQSDVKFSVMILNYWLFLVQ